MHSFLASQINQPTHFTPPFPFTVPSSDQAHIQRPISRRFRFFWIWQRCNCGREYTYPWKWWWWWLRGEREDWYREMSGRHWDFGHRKGWIPKWAIGNSTSEGGIADLFPLLCALIIFFHFWLKSRRHNGFPSRPESGHPTRIRIHRNVPLSHYHPTHQLPAALLSLSWAEGQLLDWIWTPDEDSCILMHGVGLRLVRALAKAWGTRVIVAFDTLGRCFGRLWFI